MTDDIIKRPALRRIALDICTYKFNIGQTELLYITAPLAYKIGSSIDSDKSTLGISLRKRNTVATIPTTKL
jgi:hypothetical protein